MTLPPYANQSTSSVDILKIFANDKHLILYRPEWKQITGSVLSTILLSQILYWWDKQNRQPFYKFKEPCQHPLYISGDSWCEELGFSRREFDTALKLLKSKGFVESSTDINRVTHYSVNQNLLEPVFTELYLKAECAFTKIPNAPLPPIITKTNTKTTTTEQNVGQNIPSSSFSKGSESNTYPNKEIPLPGITKHDVNNLIQSIPESKRSKPLEILLYNAILIHSMESIQSAIFYTIANSKGGKQQFKAYLGKTLENGWGEGFEPALITDSKPKIKESDIVEEKARREIKAKHETLNKMQQEQPEEYRALEEKAALEVGCNLKRLKVGDLLKIKFKIMEYLNL